MSKSLAIFIGISVALVACGPPQPNIKPRFASAAEAIQTAQASEAATPLPDIEVPSIEDLETTRKIPVTNFRGVFEHILDPSLATPINREANAEFTAREGPDDLIITVSTGSESDDGSVMPDDSDGPCRRVLASADDSLQELRIVPVSETVVAGEVIQACVLLTSSAEGLSGFDITLNVSSGTVAEIVGVSMPAFGLATITPAVDELPPGPIRIRSADLAGLVSPGAHSTLLATIDVRGVRAGSTSFRVNVDVLDDDGGMPIDAPLVTSKLAVVTSP